MPAVVTKATRSIFIYSISPFTLALFFLLASQSYPAINSATPDSSQTENIKTLNEEAAKISIETIKESARLNVAAYNTQYLELESNLLQQATELSKGSIGIYYKNLRTEKIINVNGDETFAPASTFKVYTAILTLLSYERGEFNLDNTITLTRGLYVPYGSAYTQKDIGRSFSISNILSRTISASCNTGQSMLFAKLSRDKIETRLGNDLNLEKTSLKNFLTTPAEMAYTLERMYEGNLFKKESNRQLLISLMNKSSTIDRIRAGLPKGTIVANKGGTLDGAKHDVAIVSSPNGDYILAVYTKNANENEAVNKIKNISKLIWEANTKHI